MTIQTQAAKLFSILPAALAVLVSGTALSQTWQGYKQTATSESPIELKLSGWGKAAITAAGFNQGLNSSGSAEVYHYTIRAEDKNYDSYISIHEATHFRQWNQNTLQNYAGSFFKNLSLDFGDLDDVYHGRANYKFIPFSYSQGGKKSNCGIFRSTWDYLASVGWVCAKAEGQLSVDTIKTFITHISYKQHLVPKDEGTLPTP